jgi:hypothetical protein
VHGPPIRNFSFLPKRLERKKDNKMVNEWRREHGSPRKAVFRLEQKQKKKLPMNDRHFRGSKLPS